MMLIINYIVWFVMACVVFGAFMYPFVRLANRAFNLGIRAGKDSFFIALIFPVWIIKQLSVVLFFAALAGSIWLIGTLLGAFISTPLIAFGLPTAFYAVMFAISAGNNSEESAAYEEEVADVKSRVQKIAKEDGGKKLKVGFTADTEANEFWDARIAEDTAPVTDAVTAEQIKIMNRYQQFKKQHEFNISNNRRV